MLNGLEKGRKRQRVMYNLNFISYIVKIEIFTEIGNTMQNNILILVIRCLR